MTVCVGNFFSNGTGLYMSRTTDNRLLILINVELYHDLFYITSSSGMCFYLLINVI